ncbi:calcium/sodium antiporter [Rhodohalobacter sp. 8-1]|uniref:calcium/sodium antiporter n=1 Tax=Rhodohalobacter sp. 8-1 TaxID=3131972 RepID=UPI00403F56ED
MMNILFLIAGVILLTIGGETLIRGALSASDRLGISPLLSGLVIVGFGTSSPELAVSVEAALNSNPDISIGNVVGSNISNVLLILGVCALITPMTVQPSALKRDGLVVLAATVIFMITIIGGLLSRVDAIILLVLLAAYLTWAYISEKNPESPQAEVYEAEAKEVDKKPASVFGTVAAIVGGLVLLIGGSNVLLKGAIGIAESYNVSEAVIGLTLVAVGTSLPELSISVLAAFRKHADVAIGNILGSNIFNLLGILGVSALITPLTVNPRILAFDQWVLLGISILILVFLFTGRRLNRWEGGVLLLGYIAYVVLSFTLFPG